MLFNSNKYSPYAWWLTSLSYVNGDVLVIGDLPIDDLYFLGTIANNLYCCDSNPVKSQELSKIVHLVRSSLDDYKFDAIIVCNNIDLDMNYSLPQLQRSLNDGGVLSVYKLIEKGYLNRFLYYFKKNNSKQVKKVDISHKNNVFSLSCITYNDLPFEGFVRGSYFTNKNIHLLKERIKSLVLNSFVGGIFINSYIDVYYKRDNSLLYDDILRKNINAFTNEDLKFVKIYYKYGKLILSFLSEKEESKYIVVISLDDSAISQRKNEEQTIIYIRRNPNLAPYIVNNYIAFEYGGFNCVFMDEVDGITVDAYSKSFERISRNVYKTIKLIAINTKQISDNTNHIINIIKRYVSELTDKLPVMMHHDDYNIEQAANLLVTLPLVTMHGDSKIENYVLDSNYCVMKIIDWELSEIHSFPLLDIIYFITYNLQIVHDIEFLDAFDLLYANKINVLYAEMMDDYMNELCISNEQKRVLMGIFILHHFARRVVFPDGVNEGYLLRINNYLQDLLFTDMENL